MPDAWEVPSGWLLAALVAPTVLGVLPLAAPRAVVACASALGHTDATVPVSALSLLLSLARILSVLQWWLAGPAPERQPQPRWLLVLRLGVALPLLALGVAIKWGAWRALPREHMFYGRQLGRATGPWCTSWPYGATGAAGSAPTHERVSPHSPSQLTPGSPPPAWSSWACSRCSGAAWPARAGSR